MFSRLLLAPWLPQVLGALLAAALVGLVAQTYRLNAARSELAQERAAHLAAVAEAQSELIRQEALWKAEVENARKVLETQKAEMARQIEALQRALAVVRGDAEQLRNQLAAYATGPTDDTLATCQARAGALAALLTESAGLLAEGAELAASCAAAHDARAREVEALIAGWPK